MTVTGSLLCEHYLHQNFPLHLIVLGGRCQGEPLVKTWRQIGTASVQGGGGEKGGGRERKEGEKKKEGERKKEKEKEGGGGRERRGRAYLAMNL